MKKEIFIRVDGDEKTGFGHLFRCFALYDMLSSHYNIRFLIKKSTEPHFKQFKPKGLYEIIDSEEQSFDIVGKKALLVTDSYYFYESYYKKAKLKIFKIISIQDIQKITSHIDLIINHLPNCNYGNKNEMVLSGPKYAIVRKEFIQVPIVEEENDNDVYFISFGGTVNYSYINKLIIILNSLNSSAEINVLTTKKNAENLSGKNITIFYNQRVEEVIQLIDKSSLCFVTPGMISYEVMARNKEIIVISLNEGQWAVAKSFASLNLVEDIGMAQDLSIHSVKNALKLKNLDKQKLRRIFDGNSGKRILENVKKIYR